MCFFYYFTEIRYRLSYLGASFLITFFTSYYYSLELVYLFARPFLHSKHLISKSSICYSITDTATSKSGFVNPLEQQIPICQSFAKEGSVNGPVKSDLTSLLTSPEVNKSEICPDTTFGGAKDVTDVIFDKGFIFTSLTEAFHTTIKICFIWSFLFFLPFFFYQFWCFFTPSWFLFERVRAKIYLFSALSGAFLGGYCFYFLVLPELIDFLLNFKINTPLFTVQLEARIDSYVRISSGVFLIVEFVFQMPLLFSLFYFFGLIDSAFLSKNRKIFILFFLLLAAFLSPPDPLTEFLIFSFFICTFEFFIWIGFLVKNLYQRYIDPSYLKKKKTQ